MLPERRDPELLLLEAIRRRDAHGSRLLAQIWVHRSGLGALERFRTGTLRQIEGEAACSWLDDQLQTPALPNASDSPISEKGPAPEAPLRRESPLAPDSAVEHRVFAEVDAAIAAMLASFPEEQAVVLQPQPALEMLEEPQHEAFEPSPSELSWLGLGERRWRQLPGAARLIEVARLGHEAAGRWKQERLGGAGPAEANPAWRQAEVEAQAQAEAEAEPGRLGAEQEYEAGLKLVPEPEQRQPLSAADRLRQQLSRSREARLSSMRAPRPAGLAELEAWLPDADLPQAS